MSTEITTAFVKQYSSNVYVLAQQKGSVLEGAIRKESIRGDEAFFERIGSATAVVKSSRHSDTPQIDSDHSRRRVTMNDYHWGDLIDDQDKIRMLISPESPYAQSAAWALGRVKDDVILDNGSGTAYSGVDGGTSTSLGNTQKLASVSAGAGASLNVQALRRAKKKFDQNNVHKSIMRNIAHNAHQLENLLGETEVTSADYNTVRALVRGELDTFLGFKFYHTEQTNTQSGALSFNQTSGAVGSGSGNADTYDKVLAWAQDGIILGVGMEVKGRISERADKSYATQVYASLSLGAVRMEEEKVVEILCVEE